MYYRALVGIKKVEALKSSKKLEREAAQEIIMKDQLKYWDSSESVLPYFDPTYDADKVYSDILRRHSKVPAGLNIDDPLSVMNWFGKTTGHIFFEEVPKDDKKLRDYKRRELDRMKNKAAKKGETIDPEIEEKYRHDLIDPVPAERTGLYAYSTKNPFGMFKSYNYPITKSYMPDIEDITASKLLNRNYGTLHDIILLGDLDFEGTYLPHVVFRNDYEMFESYPDSEDGIDIGGDPEEIKAFLEETLDRKDYVAIIECEL